MTFPFTPLFSGEILEVKWNQMVGFFTARDFTSLVLACIQTTVKVKFWWPKTFHHTTCIQRGLYTIPTVLASLRQMQTFVHSFLLLVLIFPCNLGDHKVHVILGFHLPCETPRFDDRGLNMTPQTSADS